MFVFKRKKIARIINIIVVLVMTFSSYITIDPISLLSFTNYDMGKVSMISTIETEYLSDSMAYNQQFNYFNEALNKAMAEPVSEDALLFYPAVRDCPWYFDGIYQTADPIEGYVIQTEYWNEKTQKRELFASEDTKEIYIYQITNGFNLQELVKGQRGYYFYIPCAGIEIRDELEEYTNIVEEKTYSYHGIEVIRVEWDGY